MLLVLLKVAISQRTGLKVVAMLATPGAQRFLDYFGDKRPLTLNSVARTIPAQITYINEPILGVFNAALNLVKCIHEREEDGDTLMFVHPQPNARKPVSCFAKTQGACSSCRFTVSYRSTRRVECFNRAQSECVYVPPTLLKPA